MLQLTEATNTYLIESARAEENAAFIEQLNADFRDLKGPKLNLGNKGEILGANSPDEILLPPAPPVIYTVMAGPMVMNIDPAIAGTSTGAAGIQSNPKALGMNLDSGGLPAPDYSRAKSSAPDSNTGPGNTGAAIGGVVANADSSGVAGRITVGKESSSVMSRAA